MAALPPTAAAGPYQALAEALLTAIGGAWKQAWISGTIGECHSDLQFGYAGETSGRRTIVPPAAKRLAIREMLTALRGQMRQDGRAPWSGCTFTVFADGRVSFDVTYDD